MTATDETGNPPRVTFSDRLLAEAVRAYEASGATADASDVDAIARAREGGGTFEQRLCVRARHTETGSALQQALGQLRQSMQLIVMLGVAVAAITGAAAARGALGAERDTPVNFFLVFGSFLGVQTALLVLWLILMALRPGSSSPAAGALGALFVGLGRYLAGHLYKGPTHLAALQAHATLTARGRVGRWLFSSTSHAMWLAFNVGGLIVVGVLLSAKHYTFAWETTILDAAAYERVTAAVAWLPRAVGFATPTSEQIAASQWPGDAAALESSRLAWSGLLAGSIVLYGLAPRLLLLAFSLGNGAGARRALRLDTTQAGYMVLEERLLPSRRSLGIIDHDEGGADTAGAAAARGGSAAPSRPDGPPVILGLEIAHPGSPWPPALHGVRWTDLGIVDGRDQRRSAVEELRRSATEPQTVVVVCDLTMTPDRGVGAFLQDISGAAARPISLVLTAGDTLRQRGNGRRVSDRVVDWRELAQKVGIEPDRVIELDLDHMTDRSLEKLAALMDHSGPPSLQGRGLGGGASGPHAPPGSRPTISQAFAIIHEHIARWRDTPEAAEQAELHRAIAKIYFHGERNGNKGMKLFSATDLKGMGELSADLAGRVKDSASEAIRLLPAHLQLHPKWLAAGALAGALGCVAAATLIAPAAIASLPLWSAMGAAITAAVQPHLKRAHGAEETVPDYSDAVRSAALAALLLDLQGRDETAISRVLERVLEQDSDLEPTDGEQARHWLAVIEQRYESVIRSESPT